MTRPELPLHLRTITVRAYQEPGDEISVEGIEGTVEELGHAAVILRSQDGYLYRIPNRALLEGVVRKTDR